MQLETGTTLGNYEILNRLGAGGMGVVYKAHDRRLERDVALKVLPPELAADPDQLRRFAREARAASALNHPNILTIHDIGEEAEAPYLVMELVQGKTLRELLTGDPWPESEILRVGGQLADGLAKAHAAGIVHRDLKPANIMLTEDRFVKILDFGLAKRVPTSPEPAEIDDAGPTSIVTEPGVILGTVGYMSPEQARGAAVDFRSDQFSLGVILYEMATGRRAFAKNTAIETLAAILNAHPPAPEKHNPDLSVGLCRLITRLLAKDASARYGQTHEIAAELRIGSAEIEPTSAVQSAAAADRSSSVSQVDDTAPTLISHREETKTAEDKGATRVVSALFLLLAACAVLMLLWRSDSGSDSAENARAEWAGTEAVPEILALLEEGEYVSAWSLAREAAAYLPDNPHLQELYERSAFPYSVETDPPGAVVEIKDYGDLDGEWAVLGTTPLENALIPRDYLRWRIRKDGFETVHRAAPPFRGPLRLPLTSVAETPTGMVRVAGGRHLRSGEEALRFGPYWIDRYEVKNREFKAFIDAGGYQEPRYWTEPLVMDGRELSFDEATARFVDRTGMPGPAGWELGSFPDGKADDPVRGVSWYEAAAYAEFVGKSLPTIYHWRHAAGLDETFFADGLLLSNIGRVHDGPLASSQALDPFGSYDMTGNVKEWAWNETRGLRYTLGSSWEEPRYAFGDQDARSPFERLPDQGFRCAKYLEPPADELTAPLDSAVPDFSRGERASDEVFEIYRRFHDYDRTDLEAKLVAVDDENKHWRMERISLRAAYGDERFDLLLFLPRNAAPPFQSVVFFPASSARIIPSSEHLDLTFAELIPRSGRVLAYPIYKGTYERREKTPATGANAQRDRVLEWSKDFQRTVDYLATRDDLDSEKLAFLGVSLGANYGPILTAVENRIRVSVLIGGGMHPGFLNFPPEISPLNFMPRSTIPTLMINGRYDFMYPLETNLKPMFRLHGAPEEHKRLAIMESAHIPPRHETFQETLAWLNKYLGAP